jgi:protein-disulfide isomerase
MRSIVKTATKLSLTAIVACGLLVAGAQAQQPKPAAATPVPAAASPIQNSIEAYLRHLYAFGPDVQLVVGPPKETPVDGLLETNIDVTIGEDKQAAKFYVSKDGKFLFRGELSDLMKDPLAETRKQIQMDDAPTLGNSKASVTLVEYSDFQCPVCRSLHDVLRGMLPNYAGRVRVVFKDFPLEQIHPWARTASIAGRCAYQQEPSAFWKMYDFIYDNQEIISAANAWTKMVDYAGQSGLNTDTFKSCMASPEPGAAVNASRANGQQLEVSSTPTVFVNGRRVVGADAHLIEQYINYELAQQKSAKAVEKK